MVESYVSCVTHWWIHERDACFIALLVEVHNSWAYVSESKAH